MVTGRGIGRAEGGSPVRACVLELLRNLGLKPQASKSGGLVTMGTEVLCHMFDRLYGQGRRSVDTQDFWACLADLGTPDRGGARVR